MNLKARYLALCALGTVAPLSQLFPFIRDHGFDARLMVLELFSTRMGAFFAMDVFVSAIALIVFVSAESRRSGLRRAWLPVAATLCVGVSLGLPLFLYMRETAASPQNPV